MKIFYVITVLYLLISFLCYKRNDKKLNVLFEIVYAIGLLFCYNTVVVFLFGLFNLGGSLIWYSIFNCLIGSLLNVISYKRKKVQAYMIPGRSCYLFFSILLIVFCVTVIRFNGFEAIRYESGDAAIHYQMAKCFSKELSFLTRENSADLIYGDFGGAMSISYINGGFLLHLFSNISSTKVFVIYDSFCLILAALLFFSTFYQILELKQKKKYDCYLVILTLLYVFAFPMNSMTFGFCYLGLSVLVVNLIILTFLNAVDQISEKKVYLIPILFMLCFSVFFSYFLFMPCVYLAMGLYYIYLWKRKKLTFKELLLYGGVTLIIPFLIGAGHFILPGFLDSNQGNILTEVQLEGYTYDNKTPILLLILVSIYLIYDRIVHKNKMNYFMISFYIITGYVWLFFILYLVGYSATYYFSKLFYLYWLFVLLFFSSRFIHYRKYIYLLFLIITICSFYVATESVSKVSDFLIKSNIYSFNAVTFFEERVNFIPAEVELMEKSIDYQDICEQDKRFLMIGDYQKNAWFYSVTGMVPVSGYLNNNEYRIHDEAAIGFKFWEYLIEYDCVVYYYENNPVEIDRAKYDVLYENYAGVILKRK